MEHPAFVDLLTHTWDMLADIATTKTASRTITLATVDTNGQPQACLVVLRFCGSRTSNFAIPYGCGIL